MCLYSTQCFGRTIAYSMSRRGFDEIRQEFLSWHPVDKELDVATHQRQFFCQKPWWLHISIYADISVCGYIHIWGYFCMWISIYADISIYMWIYPSVDISIYGDVSINIYADITVCGCRTCHHIVGWSALTTLKLSLFSTHIHIMSLM